MFLTQVFVFTCGIIHSAGFGLDDLINLSFIGIRLFTGADTSSGSWSMPASKDTG